MCPVVVTTRVHVESARLNKAVTPAQYANSTVLLTHTGS